MLFVKEINYADAEKEYEFVRDNPADENGFLNEWSGISREEFNAKALPLMIGYSEGKGLPEGYVPETFLFLWDNDIIVGQFRIRHYLCESLRSGAGHIGYFIQKKFRGKGYGTEGLRLTLEMAKNIVPEDEFYLRVNKDNPASLRVMKKNGGYIAAEDDCKYYVCIKNIKNTTAEKNIQQ
jgi:predicted acetyltransferase